MPMMMVQFKASLAVALFYKKVAGTGENDYEILCVFDLKKDLKPFVRLQLINVLAKLEMHDLVVFFAFL